MRAAESGILTQHGYHVLVAKDGEEALNIAKENKQDLKLIITDIHMPNMDGLVFLKQLKATEYGRFVPVIMLTTYSQQDKVDQARMSGASAFVVKPFSETQLLNGIQQLIR